MSEDLRQVRIEKLQRLWERGVPVYPGRFDRTHSLEEATKLEPGTKDVRVAGRVIAIRTFGKLTFAHLQDAHARVQIALEKAIVDQGQWELFHDLIDRGDFLGCWGEMFVTKKGELTLQVRGFEFHGKGLRPLPEKRHGLKDVEMQQRRRYLDLIMSPESRARFSMRTKVVRELRRFLDDHGFEEVETPVLQTVPSGAVARPFISHHNALDLEVYLRVAPETWLKRLVVGGYDKVYELARCFRNEGMDPSHLQDFSMLEYYCAYWSWEDNMAFTEKLIRHVLREVVGSEQIEWRGRKIDFSGEWPRVDQCDLIREKTGIDAENADAEELRAKAKELGLKIEKVDQLGRGNLIDAIYKHTCRDDLIQPCFLTGIPADALPLARRNDANPRKADCFQLLVNGWEILKAYSELVDPILQRQLFEEQDSLRTGGDDEAMYIDEDYLLAMEFGMPPISGWGMGIERFCALLAGVDSLRDVTLFPLLKPLADEPETHEGADTTADVGDFGMSRVAAMDLLRDHISDDYLTKHCLASAAVMEAVAERFDKNRDTFWCMGLLHDLDFEEVKEPHLHTRKTIEILKEHGVTDPVILKAILAHNAEGIEEVERTRWLDYALSCSETVTGLVMAVAKVMPDKKLAGVKPSSVRKRMKKKEFARNVSRESIRQCEHIGLTLEEFSELAVSAMKGISDDLGM
ncbi:MAG: lysine--tRNA ligase [Planctomycetota bacterium]